jgi:hypothetical protein
MKKLFFTFFNIFLIFLSTTTVYAWDDCPYGKTNSSCTFPGQCGKYIDTNHDGICDHCEPAPTQSESNINVQNNDEIENSSDELIDKYIPIPSNELKNYTINQICEKFNISQKCLIDELKLKINEIESKTEIESKYESKNENIQLTEDIVDEYIDISGSELKSYSIKQICERYYISSENLKKNLGLNPSISDDTTFYTLKKTYGISPSKSKEAILKCLIDEGKVKLNTEEVQNSTNANEQLKETLFKELNGNTSLGEIKEVYDLSPTDIKEAILNCMIKSGIVNISKNGTENISTSYLDSNYGMDDNSLNTSKSIIDKIVNILFMEINLKKLFNGFL